MMKSFLMFLLPSVIVAFSKVSPPTIKPIIINPSVSKPVIVGSTEPFLSFQNGLLDQEALRQGVVKFREHTPEYFSTLAIPYAYDANAKCLKFLEMLRRSTANDVDLIAVLQEMFGACFWLNNEFHRFFILAGDGCTGKSSSRAALQACLGVANCFAMQLETLGGEFALQGVQHKLALIVEEISKLDLQAEGTIKALTSGAPMRMNRKFLDPITVTIGGETDLLCERTTPIQRSDRWDVASSAAHPF